MAGVMYSTREAKKLMKDNGFDYIGCKGDHYKYRRNEEVVIITKDPNPLIMQRLIKTYRLRAK